MTFASVTARKRSDTGVMLDVAGEIDLSNADLVEHEILDHTDNTMTLLTIDLTDVTYLDSAGLRMLFVLATRLEISQIDFTLLAPLDSPARRVIEFAGMTAMAVLLPERE